MWVRFSRRSLYRPEFTSTRNKEWPAGQYARVDWTEHLTGA